MDGEDDMDKEERQETYDGSCIQQAIRGRGEPAVQFDGWNHAHCFGYSCLSQALDVGVYTGQNILSFRALQQKKELLAPPRLVKITKISFVGFPTKILDCDHDVK